MTSNKHVDLKKIENFVRSKYYPEDISKSSLPWQALLWQMIGLRLNSYGAKYFVF